MVTITKVQRLMLFTLGRWYSEANKQLAGKHLQLAISKKVFIDVVIKAGLAQKKERALYKNLESLEKKKLISYMNKCLGLTKRGHKVFSLVNNELDSYVCIIHTLTTEDPLNYSKKVQTMFK